MRELLLFRHAKSAWDDPTLLDHERDLAPRGRKAAPRMGRLIAAQGLVPDLVLCSTAKRAVRTWELAAAELPRPVEVKRLASLYLAPPSRLLRIVRRQPDAVHRLLVVGHDPGLHRLALALVGEEDAHVRNSGLIEKFPTAALARIALPVEHWSEVGPGAGRLLAFYKPRALD
ncbi:MAG: histidine phosphatase family protein [Geminicoccaceae bacterium]|nr:histidine phosphatase family protein [Geminicoccaceae bacterium]MCX7631450.1 histidine phosphatase family protein [Geminicoccaceae bacterium]MDW8125015.1 histidine phosphatase family protein [Geminicoccaceae bacterium]